MTIRNQRFSLLKQPISSTLNQHLIDYPTPSNLSYWWGFGPLAGVCLVIQIVTGVFLAMHYTPHVDLAFNSVEHVMRDVEGGWLLRYMHANGASMFLIVVHLHIFRGLYHASYSSPREFVWCLGVVIFLLMIVTAFTGYVLPWGQMSFWGATVITSLASAIPVVGDTIVTWLWGGFSVDNATLNRFFSLHHLLPFILVGASLLHLAALHQYGSNNPLGVHSEMDKISFYPYFYVKDLVGWVAFAIFFFYIFICNDGDGVLGISRILKLRNQLVSHRGNNSLRPRNDPNSLEDILRKGFSTGVSYMYSSLFEVSQWCKAVDLLGKRKKITLISCFGEISGSRGMERNIFYLISKSSYSTSSNPGWGITCRNDIMLIHVLHGQGKIGIEK